MADPDTDLERIKTHLESALRLADSLGEALIGAMINDALVTASRRSADQDQKTGRAKRKRDIDGEA